MRSSLFCIHQAQEARPLFPHIYVEEGLHSLSMLPHPTGMKLPLSASENPSKVLFGKYAWSQKRSELLQDAEAWCKEKISMKLQEQLHSAGFFYYIVLLRNSFRSPFLVVRLRLVFFLSIKRSEFFDQCQHGPHRHHQGRSFGYRILPDPASIPGLLTEQCSQLYGNTVPSYPICSAL